METHRFAVSRHGQVVRSHAMKSVLAMGSWLLATCTAVGCSKQEQSAEQTAGIRARAAVADKASPSGDSVWRTPRNYRFACKSDVEGVVEVWDDKALIARSVPVSAKTAGGWCRVWLSWDTSAKVSKGYLPLARQYRWRFVGSKGDASAFVPFRIVPLMRETFTSSLGDVQVSNASHWSVAGGHAVTTHQGSPATLLLDTDYESRPGFGAGDTVRVGYDYVFAVNPACAADECELALRFNGSPFRCDASGCRQQDYSELLIDREGFSRLRIVQWVGVANGGHKVVRDTLLNSAVVYLSDGPQKIRITQGKGFGGDYLRVTTLNGTECLQWPAWSMDRPYAGVEWTSLADDEDSQLGVDAITVSTTPEWTHCHFPLAPLD